MTDPRQLSLPIETPSLYTLQLMYVALLNGVAVPKSKPKKRYHVALFIEGGATLRVFKDDSTLLDGWASETASDAIAKARGRALEDYARKTEAHRTTIAALDGLAETHKGK